MSQEQDNISNKILDERETRKRMLNYAKSLGFEMDLLQLFAKYDKLMRNCTNDQERIDMGKLAAYSVYNLLGKGGDFYINGELIHTDKKTDDKGKIII